MNKTFFQYRHLSRYVRFLNDTCIFTILLFLLIFPSCKSSHTPTDKTNDIDTLKVVTLYGPTSYFLYRGQPMGIDYENVRRFAEEEGMELEIIPVSDISELIEYLKEGKAHLAAYPVPDIAEYKDDVIHCGPVEVSRQVLVQKKSDKAIKDVTELVGKDITVKNQSKYLYRLENLNEELGGGINIRTEANDTISMEDLLQMTDDGIIDFTVTDSQTASLYQSAFPKLDMTMPISSDQAASWVTAPGLDSLAFQIDRWENRSHSSEFVKEIYKKYYDSTFNEQFDSKLTYFKSRGLDKGNSVSDYDALFKKNESVAGYDWKLLAAIAYCESGYNPAVESRFGAKGLMQVMPSSAEAMGVNRALLGNPDSNVLAAAKILSNIDKIFSKRVENPEERMKFVVAAYNSGAAHILDAMALAEKYGFDPQKWSGNVSVTALMKSRPEFYNDPVVKYGYFRGRETVDFVDHVSAIYHYLKETLKS